MFLQVYKYFFCSKTNRPSLRWVEIGICIGRESSNVLNKFYLFEEGSEASFSIWQYSEEWQQLIENSANS